MSLHHGSISANHRAVACYSVCKVESDFSSVPLTNFKLKNRHFWQFNPRYHRIDYVVKVNIGPADISFELWHNGVKLSKDNPIKVEWHAASAPEPSTMPMNNPYQSQLPAAQSSVGFGMNGMNGIKGRKPVPMNGNVYGQFGSPPANHSMGQFPNRVY